MAANSIVLTIADTQSVHEVTVESTTINLCPGAGAGSEENSEETIDNRSRHPRSVDPQTVAVCTKHPSSSTSDFRWRTMVRHHSTHAKPRSPVLVPLASRTEPSKIRLGDFPIQFLPRDGWWQAVFRHWNSRSRVYAQRLDRVDRTIRRLTPPLHCVSFRSYR